MITVVWGKDHVRAMVRLAWRTMLAPGNLPAMVRHMEVSYALYIREEDLEFVKESPAFTDLKRLIDIDVYSFSDREIHENRYSWHWTVWKQAIDWARKNEYIVMLAIPDVLYFEGTLGNWAYRISDGARAIFTIGTWVAEETFLPEFDNLFPDAAGLPAALSRDDAMALILRHMHPIVAASLRESGRHLVHFDRMSEAVAGQGLTSRIFSSQPLVFDPNHFQLNQNSCPLNRFEDIAVVDTCILSTAPLLHMAEFYCDQAPFDDSILPGLSSWANENMARSHFYESQNNYNFTRGDVTRDESSWSRSSSMLDAFRLKMLATHAIALLWRHALDQNCTTASSLLACATARHQLHRHVDINGGYTVLLPINGAFAGWYEAALLPLMEGKAAYSLIDIIRDHIVPQRLYLSPGTSILLASENKNTPEDVWEVSTLSGRRLWIHNVEPQSDGSHITDRQHRIGFAAVYCIDRMITPPSDLTER